MNTKQIDIMRNILFAVETGGQVYGKAKYDSFVEAYHSSDNEHAITIGAGQWYATNAKRLLQTILEKDPKKFRKLDKGHAIEADLQTADWAVYRISSGSTKAQSIRDIISSATGQAVQDEMMEEQVVKFEKEMQDIGISDVMAICMGINLRHLGGLGAVKRVIRKTAKPYTIDSIWAAMQSDTGNQVGGPLYRSRHEKVITWIKEKIPEAGSSVEGTKEVPSVHYISNCGSDENGRATGGKAGDQTGGEWCLRSWYNRPWDCVLRHPDAQVRQLHAELATEAAKNDHIGYDQNERYTFENLLPNAKWRPANITKDCETDCSAGVIAIAHAIGRLTGRAELQNLQATYTGNMKAGFKAAGYQVLTGSKYTSSPDYLLPGDILLNELHHTATNITKGSKAEATTEPAAKPAATPASSGSSSKSGKLSTTPQWVGEVTVNDLYVRTWAGTSYPQIKSWPTLNAGNLIDVCDTVYDTAGRPWYYVRIQGKIFGFVYAAYVKVAE